MPDRAVRRPGGEQGQGELQTGEVRVDPPHALQFIGEVEQLARRRGKKNSGK
ncbi:hypothetical protein [Streptomyces griseus]|uniref:hypothetical protein n=1 Tax=Streptomyces griseus TaxID=1911 RepID=UPI002D21C5A1|nr:hypothetical protein [Streptomyces griseus]